MHNPVRFGIIGVGGMGNGHARNMPDIPEAELTAVCDISPEALQAATDSYNVPGFATHAELLDSGLVDAVLIATPHYFHPPIAIDAMERGIHCHQRKADGSDRLRRRSDDRDRQTLRRRLRGDVPAADVARQPGSQASRGRGPAGRAVSHAAHRRPLRSQATTTPPDGRHLEGRGGGVLLNQAPHGMDLSHGSPECPRASSAKSTRASTRLRWRTRPPPSSSTRTAPSATSWKASMSIPPGCALNSPASVGSWRCRTIRSASGRSTRRTRCVRRRRGDVGPSRCRGSLIELEDRPTGHAAIVGNVARAILHGEPLISPGPDAIYSLELANAILLSGHSGQPVTLPVDRAAYDAFIEAKQATSQDKHVADQRVTDPNHLK